MGPMLHDIRTLYITAAIIAGIFAGAILGTTFGAPTWFAAAVALWLAVTIIAKVVSRS